MEFFAIVLTANKLYGNLKLVLSKTQVIYYKTGDSILQIWLDIYPCFSDTVNIWGGYLPNLNIPIVIKDEKGIGQAYYNPIILNDTIRQSYYCDEYVIENQIASFDDSFGFNRESIVVGLMFFANKETNKLFRNGITFVENIE